MEIGRRNTSILSPPLSAIPIHLHFDGLSTRLNCRVFSSITRTSKRVLSRMLVLRMTSLRQAQGSASGKGIARRTTTTVASNSGEGRFWT